MMSENEREVKQRRIARRGRTEDQWRYGQGRNQGCDLKPFPLYLKMKKECQARSGRNLKPALSEIVSTVWGIPAQVSVPESAADALNRNGRGLVADGGGARGFDGFGETPAHRTQDESRHFPLRSERDVGCLLGELGAAVQQQPSLSQELG